MRLTPKTTYLAIITWLFVSNVAFGFDSWHSSDASCNTSKSEEKLKNSVCYKLLGSLSQTYNSHAPYSYSSSILRGYLGAPISTSQRFHFEASRDFYLNNENIENYELTKPSNQLHLLAFDSFEPVNQLSFMAGTLRPAFGVNFQTRDEQEAFLSDLEIYGRLINGFSISFPGSVYDSYSFSMGQISHHNTPEQKPDNIEHQFAFRYGRATSLLYKTNFYLSSLVTDGGKRKIGLALVQSDHRNSTTALEFVREGNTESSDLQYFRISHISPEKGSTRTRVQWDWHWNKSSKFSVFTADKIIEHLIFEYEISHYTETENDIPVFWHFGLHFKMLI